MKRCHQCDNVHSMTYTSFGHNYCIICIKGDPHSPDYETWTREACCNSHCYGKYRSKKLELSRQIFNDRMCIKCTTVPQVKKYVESYTKMELFVYDMTMILCRMLGIIIDKVYLVGSGPKKWKEYFGKYVGTDKSTSWKYITVPRAFDVLKGIPATEKYLPDNNPYIGDDLENLLCQYAKDIPLCTTK